MPSWSTIFQMQARDCDEWLATVEHAEAAQLLEQVSYDRTLHRIDRWPVDCSNLVELGFPAQLGGFVFEDRDWLFPTGPYAIASLAAAALLGRCSSPRARTLRRAIDSLLLVSLEGQGLYPQRLNLQHLLALPCLRTLIVIAGETAHAEVLATIASLREVSIDAIFGALGTTWQSAPFERIFLGRVGSIEAVPAHAEFHAEASVIVPASS